MRVVGWLLIAVDLIVVGLLVCVAAFGAAFCVCDRPPVADATIAVTVAKVAGPPLLATLAAIGVARALTRRGRRAAATLVLPLPLPIGWFCLRAVMG